MFSYKVYNNTSGRKEYMRNYRLQWRYGITAKQYDQMLVEQNNCCYLCNKHQINFKHRLDVDHNHVTKEVRKLLCRICNLMVGHSFENTAFVQNSIDYLSKERVLFSESITNKSYGLTGKESLKFSQIKWKYNISKSQWDELYNNQNGCCAICKKSDKEIKQELFVDHCHNTDEVRGLLCNSCNAFIGYSNEDVELLKKLFIYIKEH